MPEEIPTQLEETKTVTEAVSETEKSSEVQVPVKSKPWLKPLLFSILGIVLAAGLVFAGYKFGQRSIYPEPVEGPTPTPIVEATPTPDPTAGWKTYIDTAYNYSIKYPSDWYHRPTPTEGFGGAATFANYNPEEVTKEVGLPVPGDKIKVEIGVSIHGLKSGQTFKEWLDEKEREEGITQPETISYSKIIVGENIDATQKIATVFGGTRIQTIYFTRDSKVYFISGSSSSLTAFKDTLNLMLSTFKFLE